MWDPEHRVTMKGVVTRVVFANPHVRIGFQVAADEGSVEQWTAESAPPSRLSQSGWTKDSLKAGDPITITGICARDGRKLMNLRVLVGPNGQMLLQGAD
jgi:hypothetical protein